MEEGVWRRTYGGGHIGEKEDTLRFTATLCLLRLTLMK